MKSSKEIEIAFYGLDESIDGVKTGHTNAGHCLVSSGVRNDTRLIAVCQEAPGKI